MEIPLGLTTFFCVMQKMRDHRISLKHSGQLNTKIYDLTPRNFYNGYPRVTKIVFSGKVRCIHSQGLLISGLRRHILQGRNVLGWFRFRLNRRLQ